MRIISGFKDYYDYIAHRNVDNKIVYLRHCIEHRMAHNWQTRRTEYPVVGPHKASVSALFDTLLFATIHVCGTRYQLAGEGDVFVYNLTTLHALAMKLRRESGQVYTRNRRWQHYGSLDVEWFIDYNKPAPTTLNQLLDAPIVLELGQLYITNIQLASIDFVQVLPPEQVFMQLYEFLIPKEIEPDANPDNMNHYEAKGFDRKTSFRKPKTE